MRCGAGGNRTSVLKPALVLSLMIFQIKNARFTLGLYKSALRLPRFP